MAFNTETVQTLNVLRDYLKGKQQQTENEKNRALEMLNMQLRMSSNEADRLQRAQEFYSNQEFQLAQSLSQLTGQVPKFENIKGATGNARALLEQARGTVAEDLSAARQSVNETISRRNQLFQELNQYFNAANVLAPELFDTKRASGGTRGLVGESFVEADEFESLVKQFEDQGKPLSNTQKSGLQRALNILGQQRFDNVLKEQNLNLARMNAMGRIAQAKSQGHDDALKVYRDQFKQWRDFMIGRGETLEFGKEFSAKIPDILSSATNVEEALYGIADEAVRLAKESTGAFITDSKYKNLLSRYDNAKSTDERRSIAVELITDFRRDPSVMADQFEFGILFGDDDKSRYFQDLLKGVEILQNFNDLANELSPDIYKTNIRNIMTDVGSPTSQAQPGTTEGGGLGGFLNSLGGAIGEAFSGERRPRQESQERGDGSFFGISLGGRGKAILDKVTGVSDALQDSLNSVGGSGTSKKSEKKLKSSLNDLIKEAKIQNILDEKTANYPGVRLRRGDDPKEVAKDFLFELLQAGSMIALLGGRPTGTPAGALPPPSRPMNPWNPVPKGALPSPRSGIPMPGSAGPTKEIAKYSLEDLINQINRVKSLSK